jgi:uncharacterized protein YndB with AHSA1/START domain
MPESATAPKAPGEQTYELVLERLLPAAPDRVFDAWVDPETLIKWWGPEGFVIPEVSLDVNEGGRWRTIMVAPNGERHIVSGHYVTIERPDKLIFSWAWEDPDGNRGHESEVELVFRAAGSGTQLQLKHRKIDSTDSRDSHREGWISTFNSLEKFFA